MHFNVLSAIFLVLSPFAAVSFTEAARGNRNNGGGGRGNGPYSDVGMLCLVNKERQKHGLKPLGLDQRLTRAAQEHSNDQARTHKMSHTGSDGSSPSKRIQRCGFNWQNSGENVAFGYHSMEEVMKTWMNSPGHRANILGKQFTMFGSAVAASGNTNYYTQDFGTEMGKRTATNVPRCDGSDQDMSAYGGGNMGNNNNMNYGSGQGSGNGNDDFGSSSGGRGGYGSGNGNFGSSSGGRGGGRRRMNNGSSMNGRGNFGSSMGGRGSSGNGRQGRRRMNNGGSSMGGRGNFGSSMGGRRMRGGRRMNNNGSSSGGRGNFGSSSGGRGGRRGGNRNFGSSRQGRNSAY